MVTWWDVFRCALCNRYHHNDDAVMVPAGIMADEGKWVGRDCRNEVFEPIVPAVGNKTYIECPETKRPVELVSQ